MSQISVIVPAYNVEKYINKCFESIVAQSFCDFEVIVLNDGSTDQTLNLIREWEQKDFRFKVIDKKNEGVGVTRNLGLSLAKSPYVIFIDPDDYLHPLMLEKLFLTISNNRAPLAICGYYDCFEDSDEQYEILMPKFETQYVNLNQHKELLIKINPAPWNKLIKRAVLQENNLNFPTDYRSEDLAFTLKLLAHCEGVAVVDEPLYYYLANRANNVSSTYDERILHTLTALKTVMEYYREMKRFEIYAQELEMVTINQSLYELQKVIYIKDEKLAMRIINEFYDYLTDEFSSWSSNPYYVDFKSKLGYKNKLRSIIYSSKQNLKRFYQLRKLVKS